MNLWSLHKLCCMRNTWREIWPPSVPTWEARSHPQRPYCSRHCQNVSNPPLSKCFQPATVKMFTTRHCQNVSNPPLSKCFQPATVKMFTTGVFTRRFHLKLEKHEATLHSHCIWFVFAEIQNVCNGSVHETVKNQTESISLSLSLSLSHSLSLSLSLSLSPSLSLSLSLI